MLPLKPTSGVPSGAAVARTQGTRSVKALFTQRAISSVSWTGMVSSSGWSGRRSPRASGARGLALLHRLDLERDFDRLAQESATGLQRHVPLDAEVLAFDRRL